MNVEKVILEIKELTEVNAATESYILGCETLKAIALEQNQPEFIEPLEVHIRALELIKGRQELQGSLPYEDSTPRYQIYSEMIKLSKEILPSKYVKSFYMSF